MRRRGPVRPGPRGESRINNTSRFEYFMRQIGSLRDESEAQTLVDYLLTQGIIAQADEEGSAWGVWVREENELEAAKQVLEHFRHHPSDPKYAASRRAAGQIRSEAERERQAAARRHVDMRRQWRQPLGRRAPLVLVLIALSTFTFLATGFGRDRGSPLMHALMFSDTRPVLPLPNDVRRTYDPLDGIKQGQLWRMVTPIFLHADFLHLLFNMWWLHALGVQLEVRLGTVRFGGLVLALALASNWAQFLIGQSPLFMGMSGVVYGLFGYLWAKLKLDPRAAYHLGEGTVFIMLAVLALGFTGILSGLANWAHAGGLLAGAAIAYAPATSNRGAG
jgi:GlpG protein